MMFSLDPNYYLEKLQNFLESCRKEQEESRKSMNFYIDPIGKRNPYSKNCLWHCIVFKDRRK